MFKFILALAAILGITYGVLIFNGYEVHAANIKYYVPKKQPTSAEIEFTNGSAIKGQIIEDTGTSLRVNMDGAITDFPKSQIKTTREGSSNFFSQYIATVRKENNVHPLISRKRGTSAASSFDKSTTGFLKTVMQADKLEQMEKLKKNVGEIQAKADARNDQLESVMNGGPL